MTRFRSLVSLLLLIAPVIVSADPDQAGAARTITFADGQVRFVAPEGFTPLTEAEIRLKFPAANAPRTAVGNARRTTTIAYDALAQRAPSADLNEARKAMAAALEGSLRNLKWIANDVRKVAGREWVFLELTAAAADQDIHNIVMLGVLGDQPIIFNFNSTVAEFPQVERELRDAMNSIVVAR